MRIQHGLAAIGSSAHDPTVVAVGVFDGVHLGHQRLLHELLEFATEERATPTVVTFAQHPDRLLHGSSPPLLVSVQHRLRLLRRTGVQRVVVLDFDAELRTWSARTFAERVLSQGLAARGLLLGFDSAFGCDREGTPERLREIGKELGFVVRTGSALLVDGKPISSTAIREATASGDLDQARRLLGRWPTAFGRVVRGEGRGNKVGIPTANIEPQSEVLPPHGVYAALVILDGEPLPAVANLGTRPTVTESGTPRLEVHLLDFVGDLYGRVLEVAFVARLRPERKFPSLHELVAQIHADISAARAALAR